MKYPNHLSRFFFKFIFLFSTFFSVFNTNAQKHSSFKPKVIFESSELVITQITPNGFQHTSYLQTNDFGNVPCNGLIVRNNKEVIVFDSPTNDSASIALIDFIRSSLNCEVKAIIPTHFHNDCLGGLKAFHKNNIPSYAYFKTIEFAKENQYEVPKNAFLDTLRLSIGESFVTSSFFGEGHTRDNVVGYFPDENLLFGGCLIKELNATKGYLGDANLNEWSSTVQKIRHRYPNLKTVVPGHGNIGSLNLLDYTFALFKTY
jgi:metallo-beta-lactamase class B